MALEVSYAAERHKPCEHCANRMRYYTYDTGGGMFRNTAINLTYVCPKCDGGDLTGASNPPAPNAWPDHDPSKKPPPLTPPEPA